MDNEYAQPTTPFIPFNKEGSENEVMWQGRRYEFPTRLGNHVPNPPNPTYNVDKLAKAEEERQARIEASKERRRQYEEARQKTRVRPSRAGQGAGRTSEKASSAPKVTEEPETRYMTDEEYAKAQAKLEAAKQDPAKSPYSPSKASTSKAFEEVAKPRILKHKGHRVHYVEVTSSGRGVDSRPMTADEHYDFHIDRAEAAYNNNDMKNGNSFMDEASFWAAEPPDWHKQYEN
ncbi:hypothetical protein UFOVP621_109 [uncultured Caudovirales phage]|uniref:Uncharacterized protein n=1 Tax=uncultured Caudovirales phage TaxID=2100421 RepID=A0A6J5N802_9CAUD|nr:hypothetical protein UFOVP621_109 [uncultured Caudovirales phage]